MSSEDQTTHPASHARPPGGDIREALAWVLRPYARYRARQSALSGTVARLDTELAHARERHTEQIERLEDLVRELVLAVEALRRASVRDREES